MKRGCALPDPNGKGTSPGEVVLEISQQNRFARALADDLPDQSAMPYEGLTLPR
jgi:hypothetical protein